MNKTVIDVPATIRYMSDWEEFYTDLFPRFPHILDKQIPGCGFTEWCLTNPDNVILCSPRNMLILNKYEQHPGDVFRVFNDKYDLDPEVDKDLSSDRPEAKGVEEFISKLIKMSEEEETGFTSKLWTDLGAYMTKRKSEGQPMKILVTYDSFRILKDVVKSMGLLDGFQIIVDEFQSIFTDSRFKSSTEIEFVNQLGDIQKVCYVSATPMIESYLEMIPEFAGLPYYELDWAALNPIRVTKPDLEIRVVDSIYKPIKKIISQYRIGLFESKTYTDLSGELVKVESREAVIYVNSVNNIITAIKRSGLKPSEVNILCANTPDNQSKIDKKLGKEWIIGKVPLPGEPRKMFTFCTRTVYLGADFYSPCARSFILSDANIDCLAVDISLDLPQILGRQRLISNPWKNSATFFYKPLKVSGETITPEMYATRIEEKMEITKNLLSVYGRLTDKDEKEALLIKYLKDVKNSNYKDDYVAVNGHFGSNQVPVMNNLVMVAEKRAFDIQGIDYKDRFSVFNTIQSVFDLNPEVMREFQHFFEGFEKIEGIQEKLKWVCEYDMSDEARGLINAQLDEKLREYLQIGKDRLKALGYNITRVKKELNDESFSMEDIKKAIYQEFKEGDRIINTDLKKRIKAVYDSLNYTKTAKAVDIEDWFEAKRTQISENGKSKEGYKLIKRKFN